MSKKNTSLQLLPEVSLDWPRLKGLARLNDVEYSVFRLFCWASALFMTLCLASVGTMIQAFWSDALKAVLILGAMSALFAVLAAVKWLGCKSLPDKVPEVMRRRLHKRVHRLIGPRTAPGRAKVVFDAVRARFIEAREVARRTKDPADALAQQAIFDEMQDIDGTDAIQTWYDVRMAERELLETVDRCVMPRIRREYLLAFKTLSAGDRVSTDVGLKARVAADVETDAADALDRRHRAEMAAYGSTDSLDENVAAVMK